MKLRVNLNTFCLAIIGRKTAIKNITNNLNKITRFNSSSIAPPSKIKKTLLHHYIQRFKAFLPLVSCILSFTISKTQLITCILPLSTFNFQLSTSVLPLSTCNLQLNSYKNYKFNEKKFIKKGR